MDSLLASYASSDDEEDEAQKESKPSLPPKPSSLSIGLPPPKSSFPAPKSSFFSALPPPKSQQQSPSPEASIRSGFKTHDPIDKDEEKEAERSKPTKDLPSSTPSKSQSSIFSFLPPPKSQTQNPMKAAPLDPNPRRVVQFNPPMNPSVLKSRDLDSDDEEEENERKPKKDFSSATSSKGLSSILPAPKNSLCLAPAPSSAASRRSIVEAQIPASNPESIAVEQERSGLENYGSYGEEQGVSGYDNYGNYGGNWVGGSVEAGTNVTLDSGFPSNGEASGWAPSYGGGEDYGNYVGNWSDGSMAVAAPDVPEIGRIVGKRGRNEIPTEIMEVKQDELIKNRPREDQVKLTGIAFGPSYQPVSSSKGKPSKLHKRKHQIGSLFFDMKQKEMELAERRAKGFLTKAETQAKYGW